MQKIIVSESAVIPASREKVYNIIFDYRDLHPQILPEQFTGYEVISGGKGEGTRFKIVMNVMGRRFPYEMRVSEPEPGKVLAEHDLASDLVTHFILADAPDGKTNMTISSEWTPKAGIAGFLEKLGTPRVMRKIYHQELALLIDFASRQKDA
jgi:hypothetical protein